MVARDHIARKRMYLKWDDRMYVARLIRLASQMGDHSLYSVEIREDNPGYVDPVGLVVVNTANFRKPAAAWRAALGQLTTYVYRDADED